MRKWISVKKRLPKFEAPILYVIDGGTAYVKQGMRVWDSAESCYWWCDENGEYDDQGNDPESSWVTHWMPMPKPPRIRKATR